MKVSAKIICTLAVITLLSACDSDIPAEETIISEVVNEITPDNAETQSDSDSATDEISSEDVSKLTLAGLLEISNERRRAINQPDISLAQRLADDYYPGKLYTDMLLDSFLDSYDGNHAYIISSTEAISDAQIYFDFLRFAYSAYNYFGGDEVFLPVFDEIIIELAKEEEWPIRRFMDLIYTRLFGLINDHHLILGGRRFVTTYNYFTWEAAFDKVGDKYLSRDTGLYVTEIVGYDLADVFRLSMNEDGEFYYKPVFAKASNSAFNITVKYENGDEESIRVSIHNPRNLGLRWENGLKYEVNIPVITIREMGWPFNDSEKVNEDAMRFLSFADEIRDEDVIIIDIRSNGGGFSNLSNMWLYSLIGDIVPANFVHLTLNWPYYFDDEQIAQIEEHMEEMEEIENNTYYELYSPFMINEPIGDYHHIYSFHPDRVVSNDKLIILLIDRNTVSAGEIFTDSMFNLENTLVIGQNTAGCIITGGVHVLQLPNSGLPFSLTHRFHFFDEAYYREGIGIAPDVWVSGDALKATLAMLKNESDINHE